MRKGSKRRSRCDRERGINKKANICRCPALVKSRFQFYCLRIELEGQIYQHQRFAPTMLQRQIRSLLSIGVYLASMAQAAPRVLVYTATEGYRHDSIPTAIEVLGQQGPNYNVSFDFTEDRSRFTQDNLANYDGIMFVSTSEEGMSLAYVSVSVALKQCPFSVLDDTGKSAFQDWLRKGGVFIGAHSANACLYNSPFFNATVGALFDYHPDLQSAVSVLPTNPLPC